MAGEIVYPSLSRAPSDISWGLVDNTEVHKSPFNKTVQTLYRFGRYWQARITYDELNQADASLIEAFFGKLKGRSGRFYLPDHSRLTPRGNPGGTPVTTNIHTAGSTALYVSGWTPAALGLLLPADRVQIGDNFFMVLDQVDSGLGGDSFVYIDPPIAVEIPAGVSLTLDAPKCRMMLSNDSIMWNIAPPILTSVSFSVEESHT